MSDSPLTLDERAAINAGRWFASLSPSLRHDILRCTYVKRYQDGELITARGDQPQEWLACAKGAVRVSSTAISGKLITLTMWSPASGLVTWPFLTATAAPTMPTPTVKPPPCA